VENNIVAVERLKEYTTDIASEASWEEGPKRPNKEWPEQGQGRDSPMFKNYS
jgi:hypothetical protein